MNAGRHPSVRRHLGNGRRDRYGVLAGHPSSSLIRITENPTSAHNASASMLNAVASSSGAGENVIFYVDGTGNEFNSLRTSSGLVSAMTRS